MKYQNNTIYEALLLSSLPLLIISFLFFIITTQEFSLISILIIFFGHGLVYVAYCILTVPFSFVISITLNHFNALNLFSIGIFAPMIALPFLIVFGLSRSGSLVNSWWHFYKHPTVICIALFTGFCYWCFLKLLHRKHLKDIKLKENHLKEVITP